ncbi:MAG: hypothetical protein JSR18_10830 [Proteobacteria bacterium]|nr:hypothetical protein [Pseudomonadota bacterium]
MNPVALAAHKQALIAKAELERAELAVACHDVRMLVAPPVTERAAERVHGFTSTAVRTLLPLLGYTRFGKLIRYLSIGLTAYRVARRWR